MEAVLFFAAALGAVAGAIGVVAMRNPLFGVLALIVHLVSLAVLFLLLSAAFVAAAQVVVYAGAVMVLYVFVVAYVGEGAESAWEPIPGQRFLAPLFGAALFVELAIAVLGASLKALGTGGPEVGPGFGDPAQIGTVLLERFLIPFEAASILLLLAAVGAVVLAGRRDRPGGGGGADGLVSPGPRSRGVPVETNPPALASHPSDPGAGGVRTTPTATAGSGGEAATKADSVVAPEGPEAGGGAVGPPERSAHEERSAPGDSTGTPVRRAASEGGVTATPPHTTPGGAPA